MSLIWADDFKSYGGSSARMRDGLYAEATDGRLTEDPDPNADGLVWYQSDLDTLRFVLPGGAVAEGGVAFRIWFDSLPGSTPESIIEFRDVSNAAQVVYAIDSTGILYAYRDSISAPNLLGSSGVPVFTAGAWNHFEVKNLISNTVGTVEARINGVTKINLTGLDTQATANATYAQIRTGLNLLDYYMKDLVVWDTAGSVNNDFFGSVAVLRRTETADVSFNWTPSTGLTGFNLIDEASPDDADYISADDSPPAASVFALEDLPADVTSIKGVIVVGRMRKTDGGDCNIQMAMKSGGSTDLGTDRPITTAFTYYWDVSELDPATAAPWTPVGFNAADVQVNRTL